jgi:hypothetical protein
MGHLVLDLDPDVVLAADPGADGELATGRSGVTVHRRVGGKL